MCDKQTITSRTAAKHDHDELYALWMLNLESNERDRKFKVRSKFPIDVGLELISGNLVMVCSDSAPSTPSSRSSAPARTPEAATGVFKTPDQADIAILDPPTKKRHALFRKNLGKLLKKFQKNKEHDESFGPTYHRYQYNCSLYDHLDRLNTSKCCKCFTLPSKRCELMIN